MFNQRENEENTRNNVLVESFKKATQAMTDTAKSIGATTKSLVTDTVNVPKMDLVGTASTAVKLKATQEMPFLPVLGDMFSGIKNAFSKASEQNQNIQKDNKEALETQEKLQRESIDIDKTSQDKLELIHDSMKENNEHLINLEKVWEVKEQDQKRAIDLRKLTEEKEPKEEKIIQENTEKESKGLLSKIFKNISGVFTKIFKGGFMLKLLAGLKLALSGGLLVAGITLFTGLLQSIFKGYEEFEKSGDLTKAITVGFEHFVTFIKDIFESIKNIFSKIPFGRIFQENILPFIDYIGDIIPKVINNLVDTIINIPYIEIFSKHIIPFMEKLGEMFGKITFELLKGIGKILYSIGEWIGEKIFNFIGEFHDNTGRLLENTLNNITNGFFNIVDDITGFFSGLFEKATAIFKSLSPSNLIRKITPSFLRKDVEEIELNPSDIDIRSVTNELAMNRDNNIIQDYENRNYTKPKETPANNNLVNNNVINQTQQMFMGNMITRNPSFNQIF